MTKLCGHTVAVSQESRCGLAGSLQLRVPTQSRKKVLARAVIPIRLRWLVVLTGLELGRTLPCHSPQNQSHRDAGQREQDRSHNHFIVSPYRGTWCDFHHILVKGNS